MKNKIAKIIIILFLTVGLGFIAYPIVGHFVSDFTATRVVQNYENQIKAMNHDKIVDTKTKMKEINKSIKKITGNPLAQLVSEKKEEKKPKIKKKYVFKSGEMLGYISIPKINVLIPICEGIGEATLSHAAGHLPGTSLPYGGKGTNCCLAAHSGLSYATLFTNLEELDLKDSIYIKVLDETHKYKVDFKKIVKPEKANDYFIIDKDKDYLTLFTCIPVTINTHRLVIRAHRVKNDNGIEKVSDRANQLNFIATTTALVFIGIIILIYLYRKKKRRRIR